MTVDDIIRLWDTVEQDARDLAEHVLSQYPEQDLASFIVGVWTHKAAWQAVDERGGTYYAWLARLFHFAATHTSDERIRQAISTRKAVLQRRQTATAKRNYYRKTGRRTEA